MKAVVILFIAGVAGVMAFFAWQGECPGGTIVTSEAGCLSSGAISTAACASIFRQADAVSARAATVFSDEQRCLAAHERCLRSQVATGFSPAASGFCVAVDGERITRQEPIYRRINAPSPGAQN